MIRIPKGQILWVTNKDINNVAKQIITSDKLRTKYYLYDVKNDETIIKIETNSVPIFKKNIMNKS